MTTAFLCPEFGTIPDGFDRTLADCSPSFRAAFEELDGATEIDLEWCCFECSDEDRHKPSVGEPAVVALSYCGARVALEDGFTPAYVGGVSLGTFTALAIADAIDPVDALRLVRRRGELIEEHADSGTMMVVMSADVSSLRAQITEINGVSIGLVASEDVCAVSGDPDSIAEVCGGMDLEAIPVPGVEYGFHSPSLEPVVSRFATVVDDYEFADEFTYPVVSDIHGTIRTDADGLHEELTRSLVDPVRVDWLLETMIEAGVDSYVELPPQSRTSQVLAGYAPAASRHGPAELW